MLAVEGGWERGGPVTCGLPAAAGCALGETWVRPGVKAPSSGLRGRRVVGGCTEDGARAGPCFWAELEEAAALKTPGGATH